MKTNTLSILVTFFLFTSAFSQANLNEYKYVIVPKQFSFLKKTDEYRVNSLTKFLFEKYGFTAFMEGDDYPSDFFENRCAALRANVVKDKGMFKTKLKTVLKDCNDQVVYTSKIGESREKEFGKSYNEALRNAFKSLETLHYKYTPKKEGNMVSKSTKDHTKNEVVVNEIEKLKKEIQTLKKQKEINSLSAIESKSDSIALVKEELVKFKETAIAPAVKSKNKQNVLYAQETKNGYQLVDSAPQVIYKIKNTTLNNLFIVKGENAIIYKKGYNWIKEYYVDDTLKQDLLEIKF